MAFSRIFTITVSLVESYRLFDDAAPGFKVMVVGEITDTLFGREGASRCCEFWAELGWLLLSSLL